MSPRDEILHLMYRYAELMDSADFEAIGRLFEHGTVTVEGSDDVLRGREEVTNAYLTGAWVYSDTKTPKTKHVITNVIVELDKNGKEAYSRSYFTVLQAVEGRLPLQPILAGRYRDEFELIDKAWTFRNMHIIWDLVGDLGSHLLSSGP